MTNASVSLPRTYYIYSSTDPRNQKVYYVGQTANPSQRFYVHARPGIFATRLSTPIEQYNYGLIEAGFKPLIETVDQIKTASREVVLWLEACWIAEMRRRGFELVNSWNTGLCYDNENPLQEAQWVKKSAHLSESAIQDMKEQAKSKVIQRVFADW